MNDIIQEVYLEVYKTIINGKIVNDYNKYVIGIAKNKIKKYYRLLLKFKTSSLFSFKSEDIELIDTIKSDIDIEKLIIETNDIERIWIYLKTKKMTVQKIFYLYYELDLTIKEISNELNLGESYIKNCLYRTLKELQKFIGRDCD